MNNEGPTRMDVPARSYNCCGLCKYYDHTLVRSGRNPVYRNNCLHPDLPKEHKATTNQLTISISGNLGKDDRTPKWCPFLNKNKPSEWGKPRFYGQLKEELEKLKETNPTTAKAIKSYVDEHFTNWSRENQETIYNNNKISGVLAEVCFINVWRDLWKHRNI